MPVFRVFLVRIFPHSDRMQRDTLYLSVLSPNAGKYGPGKLQIRILFAQWNLVKSENPLSRYNLWLKNQGNPYPLIHIPTKSIVPLGTKVYQSNITKLIPKLVGVKFRNSLENINNSTIPLGWTKSYTSMRWKIKTFLPGSSLVGLIFTWELFWVDSAGVLSVFCTESNKSNIDCYNTRKYITLISTWF